MTTQQECNDPVHNWAETTRQAADVHFCGECCAHLDEFKADCGEEHVMGANFCVRCGTSVPNVAETARVSPPPAPSDSEEDGSAYTFEDDDEPSNPREQIDLTGILSKTG